MKTFAFALLILLSTFTSVAFATNYTNAGTAQIYSLNSGDTLRVTGGTYTGAVNAFNNGAVIIVSATATFKPGYLNTPNGKIINYGNSVFGTLGTSSNFKFENYGPLNVTGDLSLYDGSTQTWTNNVAASINIGGSFYMNNAVFTNYAAMYVGGNFALYNPNSNFINRGLVTIGGDISISNGTLTNQNRITSNQFNAWGGQVVNEGSIQPKGNMVFNSGTNYTNQCLLITNAGFTNYGNYTNNGLLWAGRSGTDNDLFYNAGTFSNASTAVVRTVKLTNYGTLSGSGGYYVTGDSYTSGTVGKSGATTDTVKVYDLTRASSSRIFDVQWGTVYPNVVYRPFAQPDTNAVSYAGCSSYFRSASSNLLPVEWNYFTVKPVQNQAVLNWSAQYEAAMKFGVERSYDNIKFLSVATLLSNSSKTYTYTDAAAQQNRVVYYRIKATSADGTVKYTDTKTIKFSGPSLPLTLYPNPVNDRVTLQYNSDKAEVLTVRFRNSAGQELFVKNVTAVKGDNAFGFADVSGLKSGVYFVELTNGETATATERFVKN